MFFHCTIKQIIRYCSHHKIKPFACTPSLQYFYHKIPTSLKRETKPPPLNNTACTVTPQSPLVLGGDHHRRMLHVKYPIQWTTISIALSHHELQPLKELYMEYCFINQVIVAQATILPNRNIAKPQNNTTSHVLPTTETSK